MANTRRTVYNNICTPKKLEKINSDNIQLGEDFLDYLSSIDRAKTTIDGYRADLRIIWVLILDLAGNKFFVEISKRDLIKIQNYCLNSLGWSPARIRRVKSTMSSLSNYVESMLDDEFKGYRPIVRKIENPPSSTVREKTVFKNEQIQELLDYLVENKQFDKACMLALAINSGKRKSELPRIKTSYFNEENIIYGALYKSPETITTKGRGSRGKLLNVYVLKKGFQPYLNLWLEYRKENNITSEWLIPKKENGIYVDKQTPITTMNSWAESFTKFLGVPFYWHSLRHLFVTNLSEANIPDSVIQDIVGWDSAEMCRLYNDTPADVKFGKYFNEDGIKQVEQGSLSKI